MSDLSPGQSYHSVATLGDIHIPHNKEYADAAARESATDLTSEDIKKEALQLDDYSLWILKELTPAPLWVRVSDNPDGSGSGAPVVGSVYESLTSTTVDPTPTSLTAIPGAALTVPHDAVHDRQALVSLNVKLRKPGQTDGTVYLELYQGATAIEAGRVVWKSNGVDDQNLILSSMLISLPASGTDTTITLKHVAAVSGSSVGQTIYDEIRITAAVFAPSESFGGDMFKADYDPDENGIIDIAQGGTNADNAPDARFNLGLGSSATHNSTDFAAAAHTHDAAEIVSGTIATARLGSGTADSTTYLRGDQTWQTLPSGGGTGTVTSVSLTAPSFLSVTGSPVTTSGTLALGIVAQSGNKFLASPANGTSGAPTMRAIAPPDLPVMVASGSSHTPGAVPDTPSTAGTTKFLREDATWAVPATGPAWFGYVDVSSRITTAGSTGLTTSYIPNVVVGEILIWGDQYTGTSRDPYPGYSGTPAPLAPHSNIMHVVPCEINGSSGIANTDVGYFGKDNADVITANPYTNPNSIFIKVHAPVGMSGSVGGKCLVEVSPATTASYGTYIFRIMVVTSIVSGNINADIYELGFTVNSTLTTYWGANPPKVTTTNGQYNSGSYVGPPDGITPYIYRGFRRTVPGTLSTGTTAATFTAPTPVDRSIEQIVIILQPGSGNMTVNLPSAASYFNSANGLCCGLVFVRSGSGTGTITINIASGESNLNGSLAISLNTTNQSITMEPVNQAAWILT